MLNGISNTLTSSVLYAMDAAEARMLSAGSSIAEGDLDGMVHASLEISAAKLSFGIAGKLMQTQDEMLRSGLDMLA